MFESWIDVDGAARGACALLKHVQNCDMVCERTCAFVAECLEACCSGWL